MEVKILIVLNLFLIYWIWDKGVRKIILDNYRHALFMERHNLLMFAKSKNVSFDSRGYSQMRDIINGNIRFAHKLNVFYIKYVEYNMRDYSSLLLQTKKRLMAPILYERDHELKEYYLRTLERVSYLNTKYLLISSPIMWALLIIKSIAFFIVSIRFPLGYLTKSIKDSFRKTVSTYQKEKTQISEAVLMEREIDRLNLGLAV